MSKKYAVVFLGTPDFAVPCLDGLNQSEKFEVKGVLSQPDRPAGRKMKLQASAVKKRALELGLEVWTPETVNTSELREQVKKIKADVAVVVAFGQILGQKFLDLFPKGCVNIHGSLLPRWRGAAPIQRAIMEGDSRSGVSLQKMVKKLDAGDVIAERFMDIGELMTATELYQELSSLGADLLTREFYDFLEGKIQPTPQDESLVTYARKIEKSEAEIHWMLSAKVLQRKIRGLSMGPHCWTAWKGKKLKIHQSQWSEGEGAPGEVLQVNKSHFVVACGQGVLEVFRVQPESKPPMSAADFIRGYEIRPGDILGEMS